MGLEGLLFVSYEPLRGQTECTQSQTHSWLPASESSQPLKSHNPSKCARQRCCHRQESKVTRAWLQLAEDREDISSRNCVSHTMHAACLRQAHGTSGRGGGKESPCHRKSRSVPPAPFWNIPPPRGAPVFHDARVPCDKISILQCRG